MSSRTLAPVRSWNPDLLKTAAIISVVFIHSHALLVPKGEFPFWLTSLFRFAVPCFLILFAYFTTQSKKAAASWAYFFRRAAMTALPFLIWSFFYMMLSAEWDRMTPQKLLTTHWAGFGWAGQYFFIILIQLILLFPMLRWLSGCRWCCVLVIVGTPLMYLLLGMYSAHLPTWVAKLGLRPGLYWFAYVFVGILAARGALPSISYGWVPLICLVPLEAIAYDRAGWAADPYLRPCVYVASILVTLSCLGKAELSLARVPAIRWSVARIAPNTMGIFVLNPLFCILLIRLTPRLPNAILDLPPFGLAVGSTLIVLAASMAGVTLIQRLRLNWLLGA